MSIHRLGALDVVTTLPTKVELASGRVPKMQNPMKRSVQPSSYWNLLAQGPNTNVVADDVNSTGVRTPLIELPPSIGVARSVGALEILVDGVRHDVSSSRRSKEEDHNTLNGALRALTTYRTSADSLHLLDQALAGRQLLVTPSNLLKNSGLLSMLNRQSPGDPRSNLELLLDDGLLARRDKSMLLLEMHNQLMKAPYELDGPPDDLMELQVGVRTIPFEIELNLGKRQDQFLNELGFEVELESEYVHKVREILIKKDLWKNYEQQVLDKLSPHLRARFTELNIEGQPINLGEAVDHLERMVAEEIGEIDPREKVDALNEIEVKDHAPTDEPTFNELINGIRSLVSNGTLSVQDVVRELGRTPDVSEAGREATKLDVLFGLLADELPPKPLSATRAEDEAL